jgi:cellulose synthase/poly-beta-1,6-N-acetylglucosamine synthase-like glycosyltransferase
MSVFNGGSFLSQAVESILDQSFEDFEFIIVDDGSNDASASTLDVFQSRDPRIHVVHQQNTGLVHALNRGCALARGKYIARMDADDVALPDRLASQVSFLESHPGVVLVGGAVDFINARGKVLLTARNPIADKAIKRALLDSSVFWHPTVLFSRKAFVSLGGYRDVPDAEDYDLWLRMSEVGELANLTQVLLRYRVHAQQVSVLRCRTQALGTLAARASAASRRRGDCDPLQTMPEITASTLSAIGISDRSLQTTIARSYLSSIRNMSLLRDHASALSMLEVLHSSGFERAERWVIADSHLCAAKVYWSQAKYIQCFCSGVVAVIKRPVVLGRPFKSALHAMFAAFAA